MTGLVAMNRSGEECAGSFLSGQIVLFAKSEPTACQIDGSRDDLALLSDLERSEAGRFKESRDQARFIRGRAFARRSLSRCAPPHPSEWRIERDTAGKPFVAGPLGPPDIHFNVSHTRGLILCVVSKHEHVGVDVEWHSVLPDLEQVAGLVLSPVEMGEWNWSPPSEKVPRFFDLWTLKEAYSKARGIGLGLPFDQVGFRRNSIAGITVGFGPDVDDAPGLWRFWQPRLSGQHSVAIAGKVGAGNSVELRLETGRSLS